MHSNPVINEQSPPEGMSAILDGHLQACSLNLTDRTARVQAWVDQPNQRGTFDILWTCLITMIISTYTTLCLNVPAPKENQARLLGRRILWMLLGIMGPEFILTYAAGQWSRAKWSVKAFKESGFGNWHMRQAFFADMGGFVLCARDSAPFPLNATQLHWLVKHKYVELPTITKKEIWDKSKQDTFTKVVTACQVSYLIIQCCGRAAQRLTITALELNTLAIVACSLLTSYVWLHKPADVHSAIQLPSRMSIQEITGDRKWSLTPLDFVDENGPGYSVNVQPFMRMPVIPSERPIQRIPNDRFPTNPYGIQEYFLCFATLLFSGIHVAGWNFDFPSSTERILWRVSSLVLFGITIAFWIFETIASWVRLQRWRLIWLFLFDRSSLMEHRRRTARKEPTKEGKDMLSFPQLWEFASITPLAIVYGVARMYLLGEAFAELRSINALAYVNVEWTDFLPHI